MSRPFIDKTNYPQYLFPHVCLECRKSFKRHYDPEVLTMKCPQCAGLAHVVGRNFKAPKKSDIHQWEKVRFLLAHGFRFFTLHDPAGGRVRYPDTLEQAKEFVKKYRDQAGEPAQVE